MRKPAMERRSGRLRILRNPSQLLIGTPGKLIFDLISSYSSGIFPKSNFVGETIKSRDFIRFNNAEKATSWKPQ